jgi:hypothetical protein
MTRSENDIEIGRLLLKELACTHQLVLTIIGETSETFL